MIIVCILTGSDVQCTCSYYHAEKAVILRVMEECSLLAKEPKVGMDVLHVLVLLLAHCKLETHKESESGWIMINSHRPDTVTPLYTSFFKKLYTKVINKINVRCQTVIIHTAEPNNWGGAST